MRDRSRVGLVGAAALTGDYVDDLVLGTVRDVHQAVADRVLGVTHRATLGSSCLSQLLHDGISAGVHSGLDAGLRWMSAGLRVAEREGLGPRLEDRGADVRSCLSSTV